MSDNPETVSVTILDKEYQINCQPNEINALKASASYLDKKMKEVKKGSNIYGLDRIAVMAALNIANDYISQTHKTDEVVGDQEDDVLMLSQKINQAITRLKT